MKTRTNIQCSLYKLAHIRVNDTLPPRFSVPPAVVERDSVVQHVSRMEKEEEEEVTIKLQLQVCQNWNKPVKPNGWTPS